MTIYTPPNPEMVFYSVDATLDNRGKIYKLLGRFAIDETINGENRLSDTNIELARSYVKYIGLYHRLGFDAALTEKEAIIMAEEQKSKLIRWLKSETEKYDKMKFYVEEAEELDRNMRRYPQY